MKTVKALSFDQWISILNPFKYKYPIENTRETAKAAWDYQQSIIDALCIGCPNKPKLWDNEKLKQREAWRIYAAAAIPHMDKDNLYGNDDIAERSGWLADFMIKEENKRFGGTENAE